MKKRPFSPFLLLILALALCPAALAQERFEAGGLAVASAYRGAGVRSGSTVGSIGFQPGPAGGFLLGQTISDHLGGELRYLYAHNSLKVSSGGSQATFAGQSHVVHYDLLLYASPRRARSRLFAAAGGGLKLYQGTGTEQAVQPLSNLALLTKSREATGVVDFGGGVKFHLSRNTMFRVEVRDYITKVPKIFAAAPGASISGLLHQWMPAFGFSWTF